VKRTLIVAGAVLILGCDSSSGPFPRPTPPAPPADVPTPLPAPPPSPTAFPVIKVDETVTFRFTTDDRACGAGRCRSYNVAAPLDGLLHVVLTSVSREDSFIAATEMYVVPGGDSWHVGPGPQISVTIPVRAGFG